MDYGVEYILFNIISFSLVIELSSRNALLH